LPDKFAAAVSAAGHSDIAANFGYDIWLRWYMFELGVPWKNEVDYAKLSPLLQAHKVKTSTMFISGDRDWNVPVLNSELFHQALLKSDERPNTQLIVFPNTSHNTGWSTEKSRDYYCRIANWLDHHIQKIAFV